ncbi:farnesyl pyrophosphate synthase-like isoform X1 [Hordeum vulgare subsp. vulgare]|uniref:farnesyl pyrophosphate synthase-like isoform X1 n=1 Tax=Hordeum vulgare subsp. vulgare TaxID=112509 RepID=UPI001D1A43DB|nr:farnesyl pyrophosphate synthase-like isoform X1 [Hordeum vulgare subsp. vulgare]
MNSEVSSTFRRIYETLMAELLRDGSFDFDDDALRWLDHMLDYNVLGGKLNCGLAVAESYKLLKAGSEPNEEEEFLACILGWGIEWLQAYFLVLDDIMDNSQTRRGKPCWYRLPKVGLIAINDGLVLHSQISQIFKRYFYGKPYYVDLLDLFNEVEFRTTSGELLDQITTSEGHKDLSKYTVDVYRRIVEYKTAYYSFYLPVGCALLLSGKNLDDYVQAKRILVEMGVYFQIQDDYLDSFGDPEVLGKIGTDIEDFKCSWLFVQALVCVDERQKDILFENYGKSDPACVAKVKALYKELNLERVFSEYERETYEKLISHIEAQPNEVVQAVLKSFLHKIHMRK